ncbi:MAG: glutamate racemase [Thermoanaerobaculia bacterium]
MSDSRPIGVFDSGVGGLTVAAALGARLPNERLLYLGDTARLPYGTKSAATVRRYTQVNLEFLEARGVKAVVVACNTASALALDGLEATLPVWGVIEPGAARAVATTRSGRVGVIATEATILSDAYGSALRRLAPRLEIFSQACPLLVPLIEEGWLDDPVTLEIARRYLEPLLAHEIDTLVLGCTHYPLIAPLLAKIAGKDVALVDSAAAVSDEVANELQQRGLLSTDTSGASHQDHFCVTDASARFARIAGDFLGRTIALEWVDIGEPREEARKGAGV